MTFINALETVFGNPLFSFGMTVLGIYLGYYFYVKQMRAQKGSEQIIHRLQEENSRLREQLNVDEEPSEDPSREKRIIEFRALLQGEDYRLACTLFRRHRVWCFDGTGGVSWRGGSLRASSSLRPFG